MHDNRGQDRQQQSSPLHDLRSQFNLLIAVAQIISNPITFVLCRVGSCGKRHINLYTLLGWLFVPVFATFYGGNNLHVGLLWFWQGLFWLVLLHAVVGAIRRSMGEVTHSRYVGRSWLPGPRRRVKSCWEPLLVIVVGFFTQIADPALGAYLMLAGFCLGLSVEYTLCAEDAKVRAAMDARIEQEYLMSQVREE